MTDRRIIIVGFMGSGKTTVARALASRVDSNMIDLDEEIARVAGRPVQQIIVEEGESEFRKLETQILTKVLADRAASIIALGGGTWTIPVNRESIDREGAITVWIDAPFDLCWQRIRLAKNSRPLARTKEQAQKLYDERHPIYSLASLHVKFTETKSADQIADEIVEALKTSKDSTG